jgi:hypothetical protein
MDFPLISRWATKKHIRGFFHLCDVSDRVYAVDLPFTT